MGTHNLLLRLGEAAYLEVLSVNPGAAPPRSRRWFGLDDRGSTEPPGLSAWVARTDNIDESLVAAQEDLGAVEFMSRGDLRWQITIPENGGLVLDGAAPSLIQWPAGSHPAHRLLDVGCRLLRLDAFHSDPHRVRRLLERIELVDSVAVSSLAPGLTGYLTATIDTPSGPRALGAPACRLERP
jgi:hypothetical protein